MTGRYWGAAVVPMLAAVVLAGCAGPGASGPASAKRFACEKHCNHDYDICSDSLGAGQNASGSFYGMGAACDREVGSCLERCRALPAKPEHPAASESVPESAPEGTKP